MEVQSLSISNLIFLIIFIFFLVRLSKTSTNLLKKTMAIHFKSLKQETKILIENSKLNLESLIWPSLGTGKMILIDIFLEVFFSSLRNIYFMFRFTYLEFINSCNFYIAILQVGIPISSCEQMDVYQENEELKEELQKLAAKVMVVEEYQERSRRGSRRKI